MTRFHVLGIQDRSIYYHITVRILFEEVLLLENEL